MKTVLRWSAYFTFTAVVASAAAIIAAVKVRVSEREQLVREEFGWTYHILSTDKQSDRLHEHLKARLYYWGMFMPAESLSRFPKLDFGPVDEAMLGTCLAVPPHADSPADHRDILLKKVARNAPEPGSHD